MKMTLDMCVKRADELHMSYGNYMRSPEHRSDIYNYGKNLVESPKRRTNRGYPGISILRVPELRDLLEGLRAKAKVHNIGFAEKDVSEMTKEELKNQINAIWTKL